MDQLIGDEELDRQLREAVPYIDDGGFTRRVLKQLPKDPAPARVRGAILMTAALVATVLSYYLSGGAQFVIGYVSQLSQLPLQWLLALAFTVGILVAGFGLVAAIFKTREPVLISR